MYRSMRPPSRPATPSAINGYQRLRRGSSSTAPSSGELVAQAETLAPTAPPPIRRRMRRFVGVARFAGLVTVLAIIVGASVGLASSDSPHPRTTSTRTASTGSVPAHVFGPVESSAHTPRASTKPSAHTHTRARTTKAVAHATRVADAATATATTTASAHPEAAQLPFTGDRTAPIMLLSGAALVLLGMLLQIAGQPLPAARRAAR